MKKVILVMTVFALLVIGIPASSDVFNLGYGFINLETVTVDDSGNVADTRYATPGYGFVSYTYNIGKYEVTAKQYTEFLNNKAKTDDYGLYNTQMNAAGGSTYGCNILRSGSSGNYSYSVADDWANRPVNYVGYWDACRFANWLCNGQGDGDTETGAYTLNGYNGNDGRSIQRNVGSKWVVPSEDEWYKAAYYMGGGTTAGYWDYETQSNTMPSNVGSDGFIDPGNHANFYYNGIYTLTTGPYHRTNVGEFENSASAYGTFDQGGNVWEWNEAILSVGSDHAARGVRGGSHIGNDYSLRASTRYTDFTPTYEHNSFGFRISEVTEQPSIPVTGISLNKTTLSLEKGAAETLITTVTPGDATNKNVSWSSSNNNAATVDVSGKVTAVNPGSCTITVTTVDGSKTATCLVTVSEPAIPVTGISLNKSSLTLKKGAIETLIATINPSDAANKAVTWSSNDNLVATVDGNGKVTAIGPGTCKIIVTTADGNKTTNCSVNVLPLIYITFPTMEGYCILFDKVINIVGNCDSSIYKTSWQIDSKRKGLCNTMNGNWSASKISLVLGENPIIVTGTAKDKKNHTNKLLVRYIDNTKPQVKISSPSSKPTYSTTKVTVNISGSAKDLETITKVTWLNTATTKGGECTGTTSWKASGIALTLGNNWIVISAKDNSGNIGTNNFLVTMVDKTKPKVLIKTPTDKSTYSYNEQSITLGGSASDEMGINKIEWQNKSTGLSGVCNGTTAWTSSVIQLQAGKNTIVITAADTSGNKATDTLTITKK